MQVRSSHEHWGKQTLIEGPPHDLMGEFMGQVINAGDADFNNAITSNEWVLVDFWAPWCGPCKALGPILEQVAGETDITVAKVNTDTDSQNAARLGVRGIPALFLFHNGSMVANQAGMVPKPALMNWLNQHMTADDF